MRYAFPVTLTPEAEGGFSVVFPDVPEAITQGENEAEAMAMAQDALVTALSFYTEDGRPLPAPSPAHGRPVVAVPLLAAAKLALHDAMVSGKVGNTDLAERLGLDEKAVRRLRDPMHRSHVGQVEEALAALGVQLVVEARAA